MLGDKDFVAHEVGLDASAQDDRDMERMGKVQEFKVSETPHAGTKGAAR